MKWLDIKINSLPKKGEIIACVDNKVTAGWLDDDFFIDSLHYEGYCCGDNIRYPRKKVIAWMPIPQTPTIGSIDLLEKGNHVDIGKIFKKLIDRKKAANSQHKITVEDVIYAICEEHVVGLEALDKNSFIKGFFAAVKYLEEDNEQSDCDH